LTLLARNAAWILFAVLTAREIQVLQLLAQGCSNVGVANHLGISAHTVRTYTRNAYRKLSVRNAAAVARAASRASAWPMGVLPARSPIRPGSKNGS
jgi:DNA-binding NarL/FixJ family response regulator